MTKAVVLRFVRVFVSGCIAGVLTYVSAGVPVKDLADLKTFAAPLLIAALTAGLTAVDKALRFEENPPSDIDTAPDEF